jgi:hypothetical protein
MTEAATELPHLWALRAREDDPEGIEQDELCIPPNRNGKVVPPRRSDEAREYFDLPSHSPIP